MDCQNDGICQFGFSNSTNTTNDGLATVNPEDSQEFFQYCLCPTNYVGKYCEDYTLTVPTDSPSFMSVSPTESVKGVIMPNITELPSPSPSNSDTVETMSSNIPSPIPSESGSSNIDDNDNGNCKLSCIHGGVCQTGSRDATDLELAIDPNFNPNVAREDSPDVTEYCDCPSGNSGILCEHFNTDIDCKDVSCKHGSTCTLIPHDDPGIGSLPVCSCVFNGTHHFAGVGCSETSTSFCTSSPGMNGFQFCTNGGKCRETLKG
jgi:hypothetical protein